jgi:hypothetical protein
MPPFWNFAMSFEYYKAFSLSILFSHFYSLVGILYPIFFNFLFREFFKIGSMNQCLFFVSILDGNHP